MASFMATVKKVAGWTTLLDDNGNIRVSSDATDLLNEVKQSYPSGKFQIAELITYDAQNNVVSGGSISPSYAVVQSLSKLFPYPE